MKMIKRVCDLCGCELCEHGDLIIKKRWVLCGGDGWNRLDVCSDCAHLIRLYIIDKKREPKEE